MAYTLAAFLAASSEAAAPIPLPATKASTCQPNSAAMACAPAMVSQETRFSFPAWCSATTRMVSGIVFGVRSPIHCGTYCNKNQAGNGLDDLPFQEKMGAITNIAADK